jgi:hypothetical protein
MERTEATEPEPTPHCIVCGRDAVTIDRNDVPMCGRHAAIFVTMDHRDTVSEKARVVR